MCVGPLGFELHGRLKLFSRLLGITVVFQRERKVVMRERILGIESQRLLIILNCLVPRFLFGKLNRSLAVTLGSLG